MRTAIVGLGYVGQHVLGLFPDSRVYDPKYASLKECVNECDVAFVCVPTEARTDGSCDVGIVYSVMDWLKCPTVIIRSTVPPGTTRHLQENYPGDVIFQPEFIGESVDHPMNRDQSFVILGGRNTRMAVELYQSIYNASLRIMQTTSEEAEMIKYANNFMVAAIVSACNQLYDICEQRGIPYSVVREGFLMNPTFSRYYTFVYPNDRGFGGKCLPKDLNAMRKFSHAPLVDAILKYNEEIR